MTDIDQIIQANRPTFADPPPVTAADITIVQLRKLYELGRVLGGDAGTVMALDAFQGEHSARPKRDRALQRCAHYINAIRVLALSEVP